jgi:hypothetical protein
MTSSIRWNVSSVAREGLLYSRERFQESFISPSVAGIGIHVLPVPIYRLLSSIDEGNCWISLMS